MKNIAILVVLLSIVILQGVANGLCLKPTLQQEMKHSWIQDGYYYSLWYVKIHNPPSGDALKKIFLDLHPSEPLPYQFWSIDLKYPPRRYGFPSYVTDNAGIIGGNYHEFGYIVKRSTSTYTPLIFIIYDYACSAATSCGCTREYIPVCGENRMAYANQCLARCAGVLKVKDGAC